MYRRLRLVVYSVCLQLKFPTGYIKRRPNRRCPSVTSPLGQNCDTIRLVAPSRPGHVCDALLKARLQCNFHESETTAISDGYAIASRAMVMRLMPSGPKKGIRIAITALEKTYQKWRASVTAELGNRGLVLAVTSCSGSIIQKFVVPSNWVKCQAQYL